MKVAILGFSDLEQSESLPVYRYFKAKGAEITAYYWGEPVLPDNIQKTKIERDAEIVGLDDFDIIVRGPAVHPKQIKTGRQITSLTDIFVKESPTKNIIGVTGTKGKGTTSSLIAKLIEAQGKKVWLGGNIGKPLLDNLSDIQPADWVVLEMSAGQLITFSGRIHIGVCLMVVLEHMDWHTDMDEYSQAKANLFRHQSAEDIAVYFADSEYSTKIAAVSPGKKVPYFREPGARIREDGVIVIGDEVEIMPKSEVKLLGKHNLQNVCAALTAVSEALGGVDKAREVLSSFSGLEHRLELVRELGGIKYYDDSFGTTPETAIVALQAFTEPKVAILGGSDKGADFSSLAEAVTKNNVRHAVLIGDTAPAIEKNLRDRGFTSVTTGLAKMVDIVDAARSQAKTGDIVLLSTGCASFGLFKDYKDRGDQFKSVVNSLQ